MNIAEGIAKAISTQREDVFVRKEFSAFGSPAQVGRALRRLVDEGALVRMGMSVYARAKTSVLSGKPIAAKPLEVLAVQALEKLGVSIVESRLVAAYNAGRSSQIPAGVVLNTGRRRINRKLGFNGKFVEYERDTMWGRVKGVVMTPALQGLVDSIDARFFPGWPRTTRQLFWTLPKGSLARFGTGESRTPLQALAEGDVAQVRRTAHGHSER